MTSKEFMSIIAEMKEFTTPFISAIYGAYDEKCGVLLGSGTFIELEGTDFLLTAAHVLGFEPSQSEREIVGKAHSSGYGLAPRTFSHTPQCLGDPSDLGLVEVEVSDLSRIEPLDSSYLDADSQCLDGDILFLHGWPGERSRFVRFWSAVMSKSFPFGSHANVGSTYSWFDPQMHLSVDYPRVGTDKAGNTVDLPLPYGMSGCAIWRTNYRNYGKNWTPCKARIVGVQSDWDVDGGGLIGTRVEVLRVFLRECLVQKRAYQNWITGKKRHGNDWGDWFAAEETVSFR